MRVCLFRPEVPGNFGNIIRTLACFGVHEIDIIMPMGFLLDSKDVKRAAMDYRVDFKVNKYESFDEYKLKFPNQRIVLATTKTKIRFNDFEYKKDDIIMFGSESSGVTDDVHECSEKITIPISDSHRSLNLAISVGVIVQDAISKLNIF